MNLTLGIFWQDHCPLFQKFWNFEAKNDKKSPSPANSRFLLLPQFSPGNLPGPQFPDIFRAWPKAFS
jgi:hypothetical protein